MRNRPFQHRPGTLGSMTGPLCVGEDGSKHTV